jgi:hypothetical protein
VLPVRRLGDNGYELGFEKTLRFSPDSLVATTRRLLAGVPGGDDYIVNVLACEGSGVAYGYAISGAQADDIIACTGREYPRACYTIHVIFKPAGILTAKRAYLLGGLPVLAFIGFLFFRSVRPRKALPDGGDTGTLSLGSLLFDPKNRKLALDGNTIDLTGTETRVLHIFAQSPNEIIERSRLQKEIWEDQGVIVGRSLDMFISKLRKKLEADPNIKIVVIRGKGYKLEISG